MSHLSADVPNLVDFTVPRIDVEHRADAYHVVSVSVRVFDVPVSDRHLCKQFEAFRGLRTYFLSSIEAIHKQRPSSSSLVLEAVKNLDSSI